MPNRPPDHNIVTKPDRIELRDENGLLVATLGPSCLADAKELARAPRLQWYETATDDLRSVLSNLLDQVEQMRGSFDDADGTIAEAVDEANAVFDRTANPFGETAS